MTRKLQRRIVLLLGGAMVPLALACDGQAVGLRMPGEGSAGHAVDPPTSGSDAAPVGDQPSGGALAPAGGGARSVPAGAAGGAAPAGAGGGGGHAGQGGQAGEAQLGPCDRPRVPPPGVPIYESGAVGAGECSGVTLAGAIARVRTLRPDLEDVVDLYTGPGGLDGSFIYAFQRPDGGFALVFQRGEGDCPSGCFQRYYWYFETGANCAMAEVGHYPRSDRADCIPPDALPLWGIPAGPPPSLVCGADLSLQDLSGNYRMATCFGKRTDCTTSAEIPPEGEVIKAVAATVEVAIAQNPNDLANGTVTITGTDEPFLDGKPLPATFERHSFRVGQSSSSGPPCSDWYRLDFAYDFEGYGDRWLYFEQLRTPDCDTRPDDYCKGHVSVFLGSASRVP